MGIGILPISVLAGNYVNNIGVEMTQEEVNNLKSLAFTDEQIDTMDYEEFNSNRNIHGEVISSITKYYKTTNYFLPTRSSDSNEPVNWVTSEITRDEYENADDEIVAYGMDGMTITEYKMMTTQIIELNKKSYRYRIDLKWKKLPKTRSYDIMGIGIEEKVYPDSTNMYYRTTAGIDDVEHQASTFDVFTSAVWKKSASGVAVTFKLPTGTAKRRITSIQSYMYFNVKKNTSIPINVLNAYGDYKHAQKTVDSSISGSISIGKGGIGFGAGLSVSIVESYDSISTAHAIADELNWT